MNKQNFKNLLPVRLEESNKGTFGHVLNIAGSYNYRGAAYLSSVSALKVGCGLVTLASEAEVLQSVASNSPDIILYPIEEINGDFLDKFSVISIGCGLSQSGKYKKIFKKILTLIKNTDKPVVIDADGLNLLSFLDSSKIILPKNTILTPHPKEMARLMKVNLENILSQPDFWFKLCSEKFNCTAVLKLHKTLVADCNGNYYENNTGNSALAHGGSGDVLCGMISGFLAQGVKPFDASCLAVYLHGLTAEIASGDLTEYSMLASDLLNYLSQAIKSL